MLPQTCYIYNVDKYVTSKPEGVYIQSDTSRRKQNEYEGT